MEWARRDIPGRGGNGGGGKWGLHSRLDNQDVGNMSNGGGATCPRPTIKEPATWEEASETGIQIRKREMCSLPKNQIKTKPNLP